MADTFLSLATPYEIPLIGQSCLLAVEVRGNEDRIKSLHRTASAVVALNCDVHVSF